jgi:hypothetical protein
MEWGSLIGLVLCPKLRGDHTALAQSRGHMVIGSGAEYSGRSLALASNKRLKRRGGVRSVPHSRLCGDRYFGLLALKDYLKLKNSGRCAALNEEQTGLINYNSPAIWELG